MSVVGGALGVGLGYGAAAVVGGATGWSTEIAPQTVLLGLGFAAGVGIFFGFWPARRASLLDPIDALRHE
jgi:putative ABC transport system permease protein